MGDLRKYYLDNSGGMRCQGSPFLVGENEAILIKNFILDESGHLKVRPGSKKVNIVPIQENNAGQIITGLHQHTDVDGNRHLLACAGTKIYEFNTTSKEFEVLTTDGSTEVSMTAGYRYGFRSWVTPSQDYCILGNGTTDGIKLFDPGATPSDSRILSLTDLDADAPTQGDMFEIYENYMFVADTSSTRIWYSDLDNIESWTSTNYFETKADKSFFVYGLKVSNGFLYVCHRDNIDRIISVPGSSMLFSLRQNEIKEYGIIAPQSIANIGNGFMGLSEKGVIYNENAEISVVSDKIIGILSKIYNVDLANSCAINYSGGNTPRHHYFLSIPLYSKYDVAPSGNNIILVYFFKSNAWHIFTGLNVNYWAIAEDDNDREILYFGDDYGNVWQYDAEDAYSDGDIPIEADIIKIIDLEAPNFLKQIDKMKLFYQTDTNVNLNVEVQKVINDFDISSVSRTVTLAGEGTSDKSIYDDLIVQLPFLSNEVGKIIDVNIPNISRYLILRLSNKELNKDFKIIGFMLDYSLAGEN